jgi:hypothetical protein
MVGAGPNHMLAWGAIIPSYFIFYFYKKYPFNPFKIRILPSQFLFLLFFSFSLKL